MSTQFIEEEFISSLNAVLRQYFPTHKLRIDRISNWEEKDLGYDGIITITKPIYIQFKRSEFYSLNYNGLLRTRRTSLGLTSSTFYSFKLHRDNSTRKGNLIHKQHNLLRELSQTQEAFYIAPLFHTKSELDNFNFSVYSDLPPVFKYEFYDQNSRRIFRKTRRINELIFEDTIGIRPHKKVLDQKYHKYTFDKSFKVAFHSEPETVENGGFNFFRYVLDSFDNIKELKSIQARSIFSIVSDFCLKEKISSFHNDLKNISEFYFSEKFDPKNLDNISNERLYLLLEFYLKDYYDIHQYIFIK